MGVRQTLSAGIALATAGGLGACAAGPAPAAPAAAPVEFRTVAPALVPAARAPVVVDEAPRLAAAPAPDAPPVGAAAAPTAEDIRALPLPRLASAPAADAAEPPARMVQIAAVTPPATRTQAVDPERDVDAIAAAIRDIDARDRVDPLKPPQTITVLPGETLYDVSERTQIPLKPLIAENRLREPFHLRAGQTLRLPRPNVHVVARGDTLSSLARRYSVDVRSLAVFNRLSAPYAVRPGDRLVLPHGATPVAPPPGGRAPPAPSVAAPPPVAQAPAIRWVWPTEGEVASTFGPKPGGRRNDGINIAAREGAPIRAAADGQVVYVGNQLAGYGWLALVRHDAGWVTAYAHAQGFTVKEGERVTRGAVIGQVGQTGRVDRPQLHFQIRQSVRPVDPLSQLPRQAGA